jgi:phosphopantothenoylcysteine decarboxylase/phosphopantothenate--cysteine ligase
VSCCAGFTESGHDVTVVPTAAALRFVGADTWAALSGKPVSAEVWHDVHQVPHVRIGQTADLVVVAPATADLLAKAAHGLADDLLTNTLLTARCPVVFAPAMHTEMWSTPPPPPTSPPCAAAAPWSSSRPRAGLTGADTGKGRLPDPLEIFEVCREVLSRGVPLPTWPDARRGQRRRHSEYLDPVRFLATGRPGLQGYALRGRRPRAAPRSRWWPPTSRCPTRRASRWSGSRRPPSSATRSSARGRRRRRRDGRGPADFRPRSTSGTKIKKADDGARRPRARPRTPTSSHELAPSGPRRSVVVGFAAETGDDTGRCSSSAAPSWPARAATCWSSTTSAGEPSSAAPTTRP